MPVELIETLNTALPVHLVASDGLEALGLSPSMTAWAAANGFSGEAGRTLAVPGDNGSLAGALFGVGDGEGALAVGMLARALPEGDWHFAAAPAEPELAAIALVLGGYVFTRYGKKSGKTLRFALPLGVDAGRVRRIADGVFLARDLVNTPTSDMGPDELEKAVRTLAATHKAEVSVIKGDDLLKQNFPMIHAVGRASVGAPRLIDMVWGPEGAPKVTLVGKGVCFDTGGLDIKPSSGMLLMKKDMGGAANVLGLASMIMAAGLKIRLRVLIPAVENSIAGNAFRPGDVLTSRKGITVEIGNTDAEGRLVLADALALADDEEPELLIDMATLTGQRVSRSVPICRLSTLATKRWRPNWLRPRWPSRIRCGACRCGGPMTPGWRRRSPTSTTSPRTVSPARSPRRCSSSALSNGQRAGRISTSSPGTRPIAPTDPPAARRKASVHWSGSFRGAMPRVVSKAHCL